MKNICFSWIRGVVASIAAGAIALTAAAATPVSPEEAERAAAAWLKTGSVLGRGLGSETDGAVAYVGKDGKGAFYIVKLKNADGASGGFVAVSADRRLNPVLAFFEGSSFEASDKSPVWAMLSTDAAGCAAALEKTDAAGASSGRLLAAGRKSKAERKWAELLGETSGVRLLAASGTSKSAVSDVRVAPLLETTWYQTGHGENLYTPNQYLSGCSATAGAQILRYWKWPQGNVTAGRNDLRGKVGETGDWTLSKGWRADENSEYTPWEPPFGDTYDWDNMPLAGGVTDVEQQAIGKLLRDVGISCFMSYDGGGGSAVFALFYYRLTDTFQYANSAFFLNYDRSREADAVRAILSSLNLKSPCGVSVPGHSIVADGYGYDDGTLYIHFNLGWGGNWNLWYNPPDLSDAGDDFTTLHTIIYNIYPPSVSTVKGGTIVSGRVLGRDGTPFPGAAVTAVNKNSGTVYTATTDAKGIYAIPVPAANYTLTAAAAGVSAVMEKTVGACSNGGVASDLSGYTSAGETANIADADFSLDAIPPGEVPDLFLEYAESDGTQFVDTGICAKYGTKAETVFVPVANVGTFDVFLGSGPTGGYYYFGSLRSPGYIGAGCGTERNYADVPNWGFADSCGVLSNHHTTEGVKYTIKTELSANGDYNIDTKGGDIEGGYAYAKTKIVSQGDFLSSDYPLYIFASNNNGAIADPSKMRIYGVKIWQTNGVDGAYVPVRDFRPCVKGARVGLWDAVSRRIFYSGSGTELIAGPPVLGTHEIEYVKSDGTQFVDTGLKAVVGTMVECSLANYNKRTHTVFMGAGKQKSADSCIWMMSFNTYYLGYGYGPVSCYVDTNPRWGSFDSCSKLDGTVSDGKRYGYAAEMSPAGVYVITATGENLDGGKAKKDASATVGGLLTTNNFYLFASNADGSPVNNASVDCYGVKISQTNGVDGTYVLVRNFKPVVSNGRAGLMDALDGKVYYSGSGTDLVPAPVVWNNTAGDNSFDNPANWSTGALPQPGDAVAVNISGDTVMNVTNAYAFLKMSVVGSGVLSFTETTGFLWHRQLDIAEGVSVKRPGPAGLVDGGLSGKGGFILDPGAGVTVTMTKGNTAYTGEAVIASGTVKLGDTESFGAFNRASFIRVKGGATLDTADATDFKWGKNNDKNKVILEKGATFVHSGANTDTKGFPVTRLKLEGDATVDTAVGNVAIGLHYNDWYSHIELGENTLTVAGGKTFFMSVCEITGTGIIDVQSGTTAASTREDEDTALVTTCAEGTIRIREGATWWLRNYNGAAKLSVKNLILDGSVTRDANDASNATLTVTGTLSGKGTTPMLTMADGARFAPDGSGFLTVTESLAFQGSTVEVDISNVPQDIARIPLFKVGSAEMLPTNFGIFRVKGEGSWRVKATDDGLGCELRRSGFGIIIR